MVNPIAAALGPVGGLAACACALIVAAIWGLFATTIALAVYTRRIPLFSSDIRVFETFSLSFRRTIQRCYSTLGWHLWQW